MVAKLFPGGKAKAFNISYDDGVVQDIRFVELLNRYGLKGTFNLNYGLMRRQFTWQHECGMTVRRIPEDQVVSVYEGHEIASHSYSHPYFDNAPEYEILRELGADKFFLEKHFSREVAGYATPFYYYSDLMADCVRHCGFEYARISEESNDYSIPEDFFRWRGSKFHWEEDLVDFVQGFLDTGKELALCQLVGHSYDLDVMDLWDTMEELCRRVSLGGCPYRDCPVFAEYGEGKNHRPGNPKRKQRGIVVSDRRQYDLPPTRRENQHKCGILRCRIFYA